MTVKVDKEIKMSVQETTPALENLIVESEADLCAGRASQGFDNVDDFLADLKT